MAAAITEAIRGWGGCLGLASESTWATAVTPSTRWLPYFSNSIQSDETVEDVPYLAAITATQAAHVPNHAVLTAHDVGGDIETAVRYDCRAFAMVLAHLMGAAPTTTGSGPYTHTYALAGAGALAGLTGQNCHGQHSSLGVGEVIPGLLVNTMEITASARGIVRAKFGVLGWKSNGYASISGTVAIDDAEEATGAHLAAMSWNSANYQLNSFTLKVDRGLVRRPNIGNGLYTDKPQPGGPTMITLSAELDWTTHALETARAAGTQSDAVLTLTGSGNNSLALRIDGARVKKVSRDSGAHHRTQSVELQGYYVDASNLGFGAVLINDNSSAY